MLQKRKHDMGYLDFHTEVSGISRAGSLRYAAILSHLAMQSRTPPKQEGFIKLPLELEALPAAVLRTVSV